MGLKKKMSNFITKEELDKEIDLHLQTKEKHKVKVSQFKAEIRKLKAQIKDMERDNENLLIRVNFLEELNDIDVDKFIEWRDSQTEEED